MSLWGRGMKKYLFHSNCAINHHQSEHFFVCQSDHCTLPYLILMHP